ncbi:MAG TPA: hypothetical protein VEB66_09370 [Opitutaceae bacterium]|nr:hypothetical protein [Opitutaceae bacterium]
MAFVRRSVALFLASVCCGAAQTVLVTEAPTAPMTWELGFERGDGYAAGQSAPSGVVSVSAGAATVVSGGAAAGEQFLRFTPASPEAALVLTLPASFSGAAERSIAFAIRLPAESDATRLVLSYGGTVALRPGEESVEVTVGERGDSAGVHPAAAGAWLRLVLVEKFSSATWSLRIDGRDVAADLPMSAAPAMLGNVLLFTDGPLDLDAVRAVAGAAAADGGSFSDDRPDLAGPAAFDAADRGRLVAQAIEAAKRGDYAMARDVAAALARKAGDAGGEAMAEAQLLAIMAYALRDGGRHEPAAVLARLALEPLVRARSAAVDARPTRRAAIEFIAAQITEQLLGDWVGAESLYSAALAVDADHAGARGALDCLSRKRAVERARASTGVTGGGQ